MKTRPAIFMAFLLLILAGYGVFTLYSLWS